MRVTRSAVVTSLIVSAVAVGVPDVTHAAASVVINELHFNPEDDNPASEFIELRNTGGATADLSGWCVDGINHCFGSASIPANGYLVLFGNQYEGALSNGGEDIALLAADGTEVDFVEYDDKEQWPAWADGEGHSLQRRDPNADADEPGNWISAPPTPGSANTGAGAGLLPTFNNVEHTESPEPGQAIEVEAELDDASGATLLYRIGFGPEVAVAMSFDDGDVAASIPGQPAGTLVRYRLEANQAGRIGTWPRQGDGSRYWGTTVTSPASSALPVFEIFMPDADYETMVADLSLSGDNGYPMVFAYDGQIFDNARIRVKGQVSRRFPKKKFKIILPPGYDFGGGDLFPEDVDEFGMHSSWSDRSFLRETLASEFMTAAGSPTPQAFPVRFERNGDFYGLYTYVEQPDGTWRDRFGFDDSEVYEAGPDNIFGTLAPSDATRSESSLRARYDKETFEYDDDDRLRNFISVVNSLGAAAERDWIYDNVDIPSVVNALAASIVMQHQDWGHKNYRLVFNEYGRVSIAQNDFDLSFGRRWSNTYGPTDADVYVGGAFYHPGSPFFDRFFYDPELRAMIARRIRTLTEELFTPEAMRARIDELAAATRPEAVADRAIWGTYRSSADPTAEAYRILDDFIEPQYESILGWRVSRGEVAATTQPFIPTVLFNEIGRGDTQYVSMLNPTDDTIDISGFRIPELHLVMPGGTVLLPGQPGVVIHEDIQPNSNTFDGSLVIGVFDEDIDTDYLSLLNRAGASVIDPKLIPAGSSVEIAGRPDSSALVSVVSDRNAAPGHVQLHPCSTSPGSTSNLNTDLPLQTRASLGLSLFDSAGRSCIFTHSATHLIVDIQGYFAPGTLDDIHDQRLIDTRATAKLAPGSITTISGRPDATGLVSLTVTDTDGPGHVSVVACDIGPGSTPTTSNLNHAGPGATIAAPSLVRFDASGQACLYNHASTHLIVDVQGYLADSAIDDVDDQRLLDTRATEPVESDDTVTFTGEPGQMAVISIVATGAAGAGHLEVLPCDRDPGDNSNLNYRSGMSINAMALVELDDDGEACIYAYTETDVVVDVLAYLTDGVYETATERVLDTRK